MNLMRIVLMMPSAVYRQKISESLKNAIVDIDIQSCSSERLAFNKIQHILPHCLILSDQSDLISYSEFKVWIESHLNKVVLLKSQRPTNILINNCASEIMLPSYTRDDEWSTFSETLIDALTTLYLSEKKGNPRIKINRNLKQKLVLIGASTGGGAAIQELFRTLPEKTCPVIVAQHLPSFANEHFKQQISRFCKVPAELLVDHQLVTANTVWIVPGGCQAEFYSNSNGIHVHLFEDKRTYSYHPCIDHFFYSASHLNSQTLAILLTGMGADGAHGLRELKDKGAETWAQDEGSLISSMPQAALQLGGVQFQLSIESMQHRLANWINQ